MTRRTGKRGQAGTVTGWAVTVTAGRVGGSILFDFRPVFGYLVTY